MSQRLIIAGGGLAGVLTAIAFADARPDVDLTLLEAGPTLGGNHTWSFYATDLDRAATQLVEPFVAHRWTGYDVRFNDFARTMSTGYRSATSERLHHFASERLSPRVRFDAKVAAIDASTVTLHSGETMTADAVIDARGARSLDGAVLRWQKFLGREVRLTAPHGLTRPTIMDACVPQIDGYRFVYLLPFTPDTILVEDTYYSEEPHVDPAELRARVDDYVAGRGWRVAENLRDEQGALPLLLSGDVATLWRSAAPAGSAVPIGLRAGLFHPVTGYSLPVAARTAVALATMGGPVTTERLRAAVGEIVHRHFARSRFDRLLNRLLFLAGAPADRHKILARFHKLPQSLIERFYAGSMPPQHQLRVLVGKPPVSVFAAVRALPERAAFPVR